MEQLVMKDISEQIRGVSYRPEDVVTGPSLDSIGILRANNIDDGKVNFNDLIYVKKEKVCEKQMLREGDILICASSGSKKLVGKAAQIKSSCKYSFGAFCKVIRPKKVSSEFLGIYFQSDMYRSYISRMAQGANINNIKNEHIDEIKIRKFDGLQQREIAEKLGKIIDIIDMRKQQLYELDNLIKSRFIEMFGDPVNNVSKWEKKTIESVCNDIYGGGTPSKSHQEYYKGTIPWVTPKDMKTIMISNSQDHITDEAIAQSTTKVIPKNSVLMVIRSGILKHSLPVAINTVDVAINQDMKAFVTSERIMPEYLLYTFKQLEQSVLSRVRAVTADNIEFSELKYREIPIPPVELQNRFAVFTKQVNKSKLAIQKSLDKLEILQKSLMQQYFG